MNNIDPRATFILTVGCIVGILSIPFMIPFIATILMVILGLFLLITAPVWIAAALVAGKDILLFCIKVAIIVFAIYIVYTLIYPDRAAL